MERALPHLRQVRYVLFMYQGYAGIAHFVASQQPGLSQVICLAGRERREVDKVRLALEFCLLLDACGLRLEEERVGGQRRHGRTGNDKTPSAPFVSWLTEASYEQKRVGASARKSEWQQLKLGSDLALFQAAAMDG